MAKKYKVLQGHVFSASVVLRYHNKLLSQGLSVTQGISLNLNIISSVNYD